MSDPSKQQKQEAIAKAIGRYPNIPGFFNSLTHCHSAELALSEEQHRVFRDALYASAPTDNPFSQSQRLRSFISATSEQRAEAIFQAISITQP